MASVPDPIPSPQQARAAVAEVARHADRLRRTDGRFRLILLGLAALYVAIGLAVGLPRVEKPALNPGFVLLLFLGAGIVLVVTALRMPAVSRSGRTWFAWSCAAFTIWNAIVGGLSQATGWWGPAQPGLHFTASAVVATAPLLVAAALLGRRQR